MKRFRIIGIVVATFLAVLIPAQAVMAASTATVTITATPGKVSIALDNTSYDFATTAPSETWYSTATSGSPTETDPIGSGTLEDSECFSTITNDGNVTIKVRAKMSSLSGGSPTWTIAATPGASSFSMFIAASGATSWGSALEDDYTSNYFVSSLAASATKKFALKFQTPTAEASFNDTTQKSGTLTLQAKKV